MKKTNIVYIGVPGSGKTTRIVDKIVETYDNMDGENILIISKTNSAKKVLRDRIKDTLSLYRPETEVRYFIERKVRTIDSKAIDFFEEISKYNRDQIKKRIWELIVEDYLKKGLEEKLKNYIRSIFGLEKVNVYNLTSRSYYGSNFYEGDEIYLISAVNFLDFILFKNNGLVYNNSDINDFFSRNMEFYEAYKLKRSEGISIKKFEDVVNKFIDLINNDILYTFSYIVYSATKNNEEKIDYVFVDEANELSPLYAKFVLTVGKNIVWGMDPMQTIYNSSGFSDRTYNLILNSKPQIIMLTKQYRIPKQIYEKILEFIKKKISGINHYHLTSFFGEMYEHVSEYFEKTESVFDYSSEFKIITIDKKNLIKFLRNFSESDIILTRRIYYKNKLGKELDCSNYYVDFQKDRINRIVNILKRLYHDDYGVSINEIKDFLKNEVLEKLVENNVVRLDKNYVKNFSIYSFIEYHLNINENEKKRVIEILKTNNVESREKMYIETIHNTKGKEFENVILINDISLRTLRLFSKNFPRVYLYEIFVQYVGMTRAKKSLYFIQIN
ncbi:MAG: AAA family ATPase [Candidatus Aenigmatarchaeota archaeon]|nr:AAA family ATPase [Candidatus Aenigmarchaeota archaeon]